MTPADSEVILGDVDKWSTFAFSPVEPPRITGGLRHWLRPHPVESQGRSGLWLAPLLQATHPSGDHAKEVKPAPLVRLAAQGAGGQVLMAKVQVPLRKHLRGCRGGPLRWLGNLSPPSLSLSLSLSVLASTHPGRSQRGQQGSGSEQRRQRDLSL